MSDFARKAAAIAAAAMTAAACALAGCAAQPQPEGDDVRAAAGAAGTSVTVYGLEEAWVGQEGDDVVYYFEGEANKTGAVLVYHSADNTYERWIGSMSADGDSRRVTDDDTGESVSVDLMDAGGLLSVKVGDADPVMCSKVAMEDLYDVLDAVPTYAAEASGKPDGATGATGPFAVTATAEGPGEVAVGDGSAYAGSASAEAVAGDAVTLSARAEDGARFVKWVKDGADFPGEAEVRVVVDGDAEYAAVFE